MRKSCFAACLLTLAVCLSSFGQAVFDPLLNKLRTDWISGLRFQAASIQSVEIDDGVLTVPGNAGVVVVRTEGGAATDNLDTITGGPTVLFILGYTGETVTFRHGEDNIQTPAGINYALSETGSAILIYNGANWTMQNEAAAAGGAVWGAITGTLSNQADLVTELGDKIDEDGTIPLAADWDAGAFEIRAETLESDVATGTAPLTIASTTVVTNLNADLLDGLSSAAFIQADGTIALTANWDAGAFDITAEQFHSDIATGTAPLTIASTTVVSNLNADLLDGTEESALTLIDGTRAFTGNITVGDNDTDVTSITFDSTTVDGVLSFTGSTDTFDMSCGFSLNGGTAVTSISAGAGDNDKLASQGYVDDAVAGGGATLNNLTYDGTNFDSTTEGLTEAAVQTALDELCTTTLASDLTVNDNYKLVMAYYNESYDEYIKLLLHADTGSGSPNLVDSIDNITATRYGTAAMSDSSMPPSFSPNTSYMNFGWPNWVNYWSFPYKSSLNLGADDWTIETLIWVTAYDWTVRYTTVCELDNGSGSYFTICRTHQNYMDIRYNIGSGEVIKRWNPSGLSYNTWHHIAFSHNTVANTITYYVDGVSQGSVVMTDDLSSINNGTLWIGRRDSSGVTAERFMQGYLDEFVWSVGVARTYSSKPTSPYAPELVQEYRTRGLDAPPEATVAAADTFLFYDATDSLTKSDTVQGILDLYTIPADTVTLAMMAGGTDGNLITYDASGDPAYVATGTAGQVLTSAGAGAAPTFEDAAGGGGTVQGTDGTYDIQPANEGATAGNARGENSVDLQTARAAVTNVASGSYSGVLSGYANAATQSYANVAGGFNNFASGTYAHVGGGGPNVAGGSYSVVSGGLNNLADTNYSAVLGGQSNEAKTNTHATVLGGINNDATGQYSLVGGSSCTASGSYSFAFGSDVQATGTGAVALGKDTYSSSNRSFAVNEGTRATALYSSAFGRLSATDHTAEQVLASSRFDTSGDTQAGLVHMFATVASADPVELFITGATTRLVVPSDTVYEFEITISAINTNGSGTGALGDAAVYRYSGGIKNLSGTTSLVGTVQEDMVLEDVAGWAVSVTASDANDALVITLDTDDASSTIRATAVVRLTKTQY